jgi:(p)ppGpp synthase/HD superfamily hydrolase
MKMRAASGLSALMTSTGLDEARLQLLARETLRIRAYIAQRFGTSVQVTEDEARKYYEEHPAEFTRDGVLMPFEGAESLARQRASAERLRATIDQWVRDLRMRSEVVIPGSANQR